MKNKFAFGFVLLTAFSAATYAQSSGKKDTIAAKETITKNNGEKNLPQQLKQNQLNENPVIIRSDSSVTAAKTKKDKKKHCRKKVSK